VWDEVSVRELAEGAGGRFRQRGCFSARRTIEIWGRWGGIVCIEANNMNC